MYCKNCGLKNEDNAIYCSNCGTKLTNNLTNNETSCLLNKQDSNNLNTIHQDELANLNTSYASNNSNNKAKGSKKAVLIIGVIVGCIGLAVFGTLYFVNQPKKVNWIDNQNCEVTGFNNFGKVSCDYASDSATLGLTKDYTSKQWDAIEKWDHYVADTLALMDKYSYELSNLYDGEFISNVKNSLKPFSFITRNGGLITAKSKIITSDKSDKEFKNLIKDIDKISVNNDTGSLFKCEITVPEGKENNKLTNGDIVIYSCHTNSLAKEVIKVTGDSEKEILVTGLDESTVINLDDLFEYSFTVESSLTGPYLNTEVNLVSDKLPNDLSEGDYYLNKNVNGDTLYVNMRIDKEGIFLVSDSNPDECNGVTSCSIYIPIKDYPEFEEVEQFKYDDSSRPENYDAIAESVYKVVNPMFDQIGWNIKDEDTGAGYTVLNYELTGLTYRGVNLLVHTNEGPDFELRVDGDIYLLDGEYIFTRDNEDKLVGLVDNGYIE